MGAEAMRKTGRKTLVDEYSRRAQDVFFLRKTAEELSARDEKRLTKALGSLTEEQRRALMDGELVPVAAGLLTGYSVDVPDVEGGMLVVRFVSHSDHWLEEDCSAFWDFRRAFDQLCVAALKHNGMRAYVARASDVWQDYSSRRRLLLSSLMERLHGQENVLKSAPRAAALIAGSARARKGAKARAAKDPKARAMEAIRAEWERRHRPGGKFAADMARQHQQQGIEISEGSVKNAITRWRKESSSC